MSTRVFAEKGRVKLVGDERDIAVKTWYRDAVWWWCDRNNITLEYQGSLAGLDLWRVKNDRDRMFFMLRWS